jgi:hypothetical protein
MGQVVMHRPLQILRREGRQPRFLSIASGLSDAVRRLEARLGVRLLNRTTRSVVSTNAGKSLLARLGPVLDEVDSALDVVNGFRGTLAGTLRLNAPMSAARLVLPCIVPRFLVRIPAYLQRRGQPQYPRDLLEHSCAPTSIAVCSSPCWNRGGRASAVPISTIPGADWCPRHFAPSWISSGTTLQARAERVAAWRALR